MLNLNFFKKNLIKFILCKITNISENKVWLIKNYLNLNHNQKFNYKYDHSNLFWIVKFLKKADIDNFYNKLVKDNIINFFLLIPQLIDNINLLHIKIIKIIFDNNKKNLINSYYSNLKLFLIENNEFLTFFPENNEVKKFKNKILYLKLSNFKNLNLKWLKILGLISLFGNINNVYYDFFSGNIYINFESLVTYNRLLDKKEFLKLDDIPFDISLSNLNSSLEFLKTITYSKKINLFNKKSLRVKYNPPNNKVLICNIKKCIKMFYIYQIISDIVNPLVILFINTKGKKTKMLLVKLPTVEDSIKLILKLNNKLWRKYKLKIYFSFNNWEI